MMIDSNLIPSFYIHYPELFLNPIFIFLFEKDYGIIIDYQ